MITPAIIVPRATRFLVFSGEDLLVDCYSRQEAEFWVMIDTLHKKELQQEVKQQFYVHERTGYRMVKMFSKNRLDETEEAFWHCRIYTEEGITYATYSESAILEHFKPFSFPKH
jgi:hypothetical protein